MRVDWAYMCKELDRVNHGVKTTDTDFILVIEGYERSGKSTLAIKIAQHLDPNFTVNNIVFDPEAFIKVLLGVKKNSVILYDEAGIGLYKRDSSTSSSKNINKILMTFGQRNLIVIMCLPAFSEIDSYVRNHRINALLKVHKRGKAKVYSKRKLIKFRQDRYGKLIYPACEFVFTYDKLKGKLWNEYTKLKKEQLDKFLLKVENDIKYKESKKVKRFTKRDVIFNCFERGLSKKETVLIANSTYDHVKNLNSEWKRLKAASNLIV